MPLLGILVVLIQFSFAYHAIKSGRPYWWLFVIMAFPVMGCVIYYFVEVFPGSREHLKVHRKVRSVARALKPDAELKRRAEEVEVCGSVDNKLALADECMSHQMYAEAVRLYGSCLDGVFANDGKVLFGLLSAAVEAEDWNRANEALLRLREKLPAFRTADVKLLEARLCEGRGDTEGALLLYRELVPVFVGLEARYRYGMLLLKLERQESAMQVFDELFVVARRIKSPMQEEQQWVAATKKAVAAGGKA